MRATASLERGRIMAIDMDELNTFIVQAKAATYVGDGEPATPCRTGSHDLRFSDGLWAYHDSYFGASDFIGEEVVYFEEKPIWAMNYYGRVLHNDLLTAAEAGQMIKISLSRMYGVDSFRGREYIRRGQETAYELFYHGGLIKD
jgi:hypothetical protein